MNNNKIMDYFTIPITECAVYSWKILLDFKNLKNNN